MLSQTVEYALRVMAFLADAAPASRTGVEIAAATKVPLPYLRKVLKKLDAAELVTLTRGVQGGAAIGRPADAVRILDVVNAVEPIARIKTCPLGLKAHGVRLCPLHKRLDQALAGVEDAFRRTTLAEVLAEPGRSRPLCDAPAPRSKRIPL
jgi:Rrf2 family protein